MTETTALRLPLQGLQPVDRPASVATDPAALRLAVPASGGTLTGASPPVPAVTLRRPELLADLRHARAERFSDRYEWLALRRRRAQIAARHALEER
jgi:hypothetical protein